MKTTILTASVLLALSMSAFAEPDASEFVEKKDTAQVAAASAKKAEDEAKAKAKGEAEAAKAKAEAQAAKDVDDSKKVEVKRKKFIGFQDNDGVTGDLEVLDFGDDAYIKFTDASCTAGTCVRGVPFDKKTMGDINNLKNLRDALGKKSEETKVAKKEEKLTPSDQLRKDRKDEEASVKDVTDEIASMLSLECGIDEEVVTSRRGSRDYRGATLNQNLDAALGQTRFAGLQIPTKGADSNASDQFKSDAECSASVLREFMDQYEAEDISELKDKLSDLKEAELRWKRELRAATSPREIALLEKKLAAAKEEIKKLNTDMAKAKKVASAYDRATTAIAKKLVINPSINELATRQAFTSEDFFLHDLAATTSDSFKGVRKAASQSLLDIYRLQSQSYLAFNELANKTNDPQQKLQYQQAALHYQRAGMNYNAMMNNSRFRGELFHSATQAGLNGQVIVDDIYGNYTAGAQQISSYLTQVGANGGTGNQTALPQLLMVNSDGTYSVIGDQNNQSTVIGSGRGGRVLPASLLNGTGQFQQNGSQIQIQRPIQQNINNNNGGSLIFQNQGPQIQGFNNNNFNQPVIQQQQPQIIQGGGRSRR